jgi:hypothetical protein
MHQSFLAISAVLGQEPVKVQAAEVESIWYRQVVMSCVPFFKDGEVGSIHIYKLVKHVRIVKDLVAIVPHLPS